MISFTEYMNKSIRFRNNLIDYCVRRGNKAQETRNTLHLLDAMDTKAKEDNYYRKEIYDWFCKKTGTLKLRDLSYVVGFDYWLNLKNSNTIDTFDSVQCVMWNNKNAKQRLKVKWHTYTTTSK